MSVSQEADIVAGLETDYNGQMVNFLSASNLSSKGKITLEKGQKVAALGLDAIAPASNCCDSRHT